MNSADSKMWVRPVFHQKNAKAVHRVSGCQCQWVIVIRIKHRVLVLVGGTQSAYTQPVAPQAAISQGFHPRRFMSLVPHPSRQWQLGVIPPGLSIQLLPCARRNAMTGCWRKDGIETRAVKNRDLHWGFSFAKRSCWL